MADKDWHYHYNLAWKLRYKQDPVFKAKHKKRMIARQQDPKYRAGRAAYMCKFWKTHPKSYAKHKLRVQKRYQKLKSMKP